MQSLDPKQAILPIFRLSGDVSFRGLLGTGFLTGREPQVLVTAAHVFRDNPLQPDECYAVALYNAPDRIEGVEIITYTTSDKYDVAVARLGARNTDVLLSLPILTSHIASDQDILTFEYSPTTSRASAHGRVAAHFSPFTHKGNILRHYVSDYPEKVPTPVMDTSFPALQGASGAPVMRASDFAVAGMLVANHERHLLPAQVVHIERDHDTFEEIRYFLPTGKAVACEVIRTVLDDFGIKYETEL